jgi:hypothetical protein
VWGWGFFMGGKSVAKEKRSTFVDSENNAATWS